MIYIILLSYIYNVRYLDEICIQYSNQTNSFFVILLVFWALEKCIEV